MSKRSVITLIIVVLLIAGGLYYWHAHRDTVATSQQIQTSYAQLSLPSELSQTAKSFGGGQWTYTYQSSSDRAATYADLVAALHAAGYQTGGQTGEFIFTSGGTLVLSVTLEPADQSPLQSVQIQAGVHS